MWIMKHGRRRQPMLIRLRGLDGIELLAWLVVCIAARTSVAGHRIVRDLDTFQELLIHLLLLHVATVRLAL